MGQDHAQVQQYIDHVIDLALQNVRSGNGGPFACVVVRNGEIVSSGKNTVTTSNDPTAHAEVVAIRAACRTLNDFQLSGCEIYSSCEPCPMCLGAIYWARPDRVYYAASRSDAASGGFDDDMIYREIMIEPQLRKIPMVKVRNPRATEVFRVWNELPSKVKY